MKRKMDLLNTIPTAPSAGAGATAAADKHLSFRFFSAPTALHPDPKQPDRIGAVTFERSV